MQDKPRMSIERIGQAVVVTFSHCPGDQPRPNPKLDPLQPDHEAKGSGVLSTPFLVQKLRRLDLRNTQVTDEGIKVLRRAVPLCSQLYH